MDLVIEHTKGILVLGGDFNLLMNRNMDSQSKTKHKAQGDASIMRKTAEEIGLIDVWRAFKPEERDFTFYS